MERTSRNRNPVVALLAVVVAVLTTWILAAPYAGEFAGGGSEPAPDGAPTIAPCAPTDVVAPQRGTAGTYPTAPPAAVRADATDGPVSTSRRSDGGGRRGAAAHGDWTDQGLPSGRR